ncbi:MAG: hypothetical protein MJE68_22360, partial [Proteobacteria bacterium]|nr:hypothetical protein [Pseudomonadota bacterium]
LQCSSLRKSFLNKNACLVCVYAWGGFIVKVSMHIMLGNPWSFVITGAPHGVNPSLIIVKCVYTWRGFTRFSLNTSRIGFYSLMKSM